MDAAPPLLADYKGSSWRRERMLKFLSLSGAKPETTILDLGGYAHTWEGTGLEKNITLLNLVLPPQTPGPYRWIQGDARDLKQFGDKSFDIVFSNSVIEHVGEFNDQTRMASEICRVGRGYWVQTPNYHFPIEPHYNFPFIQYCPYFLKAFVAWAWPLSGSKREGAVDPVGELTSVRLLNLKEVRTLFPKADIYREPFLGLAKSWVAYKF